MISLVYPPRYLLAAVLLFGGACSSVPEADSWFNDPEIRRVVKYVEGEPGPRLMFPYRVAVAPMTPSKAYREKVRALQALEAQQRSALAWQDQGELAKRLRERLLELLFPFTLETPGPDAQGFRHGGFFEAVTMLDEGEDDYAQESAERREMPPHVLIARKSRRLTHAAMNSEHELDVLLHETRRRGGDLLLRFVLDDLEVRYVERDLWRFWANAFTWLWTPVPGFWIADEYYLLRASWRLELYDASDNQIVYRKLFSAEQKLALDDFDRGWKFLDILLLWPGAGDWPGTAHLLLPLVERRLAWLMLRDLALSGPLIEFEQGTLSDGRTPDIEDGDGAGRLRDVLNGPRGQKALEKTLFAAFGLDLATNVRGDPVSVYGGKDAEHLIDRFLMHKRYQQGQRDFNGHRHYVKLWPHDQLQRRSWVLTEEQFNDFRDVPDDGDAIFNPDITQAEVEQWREDKTPTVRTLPGLLSQSTPHDVVVLFYSGVMPCLADANGAGIQDAYLLLQGADFSGEPDALTRVTAPNSDQAISLSELGALLREHCRTRRVALVLDVSLAGGGARNARALVAPEDRARLIVPTIEQWTAYLDRALPPGIAVRGAAQPGQEVRVYRYPPDLERSLFTHALAETWQHEYLPRAKFEDVTGLKFLETLDRFGIPKVVELSTLDGKPQRPFVYLTGSQAARLPDRQAPRLAGVAGADVQRAEAVAPKSAE